MSEYQYYEFRAIDRPLTEKEMDALGNLSSRAEITPTSLTNTYNYGSFKGDPAALMDRYFDAFVYVANWGTHRLMFRIPGRFLDAKVASMYCDDEGESLSLKAKKEHIVLKFSSNEEPDEGWTEGEPWMPALIALRAELMRGDYRALYLGWLASLPRETPDEDDDYWDCDRREPPVPPGLAKLSAPLRELAEFLRIDDELIEVAASGNTGEAPAEPARTDLAKWIKGLPVADKNDYLLRFLAEDGNVVLRAEMSKRFRDATATKAARPARGAKLRTVAQLLTARDALIEEKTRKSAARQAKGKVGR